MDDDLAAAPHLLIRTTARRRLRRITSAGVLCLLAPAALLFAGTASAASPRARASIVGGHATPIEDIPFQVALYDPQITPGPGEAANPIQSQFCAGAVLDATHVITAGHCVMDQLPHGVASPQQIEVLAKTNNLDTDEDSGYIEDPVSATSFDPEWEPVSNEHDVGLLTLQNPLWTGAEPVINGTSRVAPVPLAGTLPSPGATLTVSGWGYDKELIGEARPSEESGFQRHLLSVQVPFVSAGECVPDYQAVNEVLAPSTICAGSAGNGPCYGDSGGPLFEGPMDPPGAYRLLGIVDFGNGCAEAGFPGIFQSLVDAGNAQFVRSAPPQAPLEQSPPGISGMPLPGQTLTCSSGSWSGSPSYSYRFYADESSPSSPEAHTAISASSPAPTYTVSSANAGQRIFCLARATNAGGYDFDNSPDVTIAGVAAGSSSSSVRPAPPTLQVVSKSCVHMRCVVNVRVSEGTGAAAVSTVQATLSFKRWGACRRHPHSRRLKCLHTLTAKPRVKAIPGFHFVIQTSRLQPGTYKLTLVAIDKAGVHQAKATQVTLTVRQPTRKR